MDDNWLDAAVIVCPGCGMRLFRVIHSPFCDDHRLYRDRCPRAIECGAIVPEAATHDLLPYAGCEDSNRDPTPEEQAAYDKFEAAFIGRENLWA
jgi:hypothetical protein